MADKNCTAADAVYYGGYKYSFSQNYFRRKNDGKSERFLHRAVWVKHNGHIPDGFVVHHKDHNTRNNAIENLELVSHAEHSGHHARERWERLNADPEAKARRVSNNALWRRSPEGRAALAARNRADKIAGKYTAERIAPWQRGRDEWATSEEGKKSLSERSNRIWASRPHFEIECKECGKKFTSNGMRAAFCHQNCAAKNRRRRKKQQE